MKAKACTKCRQWKARCDASDGVPGGCSRCRSQNLPCVFDATFKRMSKDKRIQQMSSELQQLRQALRDSTSDNTDGSPLGSDGAAGPEPADPVVWEAQLPSIPDALDSSSPHFSTSLSTSSMSAPTVPLAAEYRTLGDVSLSLGQVERHFKTYFARHHPHLPFQVGFQSLDEVYTRTPLLFWVICAVTSSWKQQSLLEPMVKAMIAETIHGNSHSVETIQALLVMCMWPFRINRLSEDPSPFYSSIATQMSLQLGLHRPGQPYWPLRHGSFSGPTTTVADEEIRRSTWLACFAVNQMQSSYLGVPPSTTGDANLLICVEHPTIDPSLAQHCRIYHLLMKLCWEIGANAPTPTGMVEPAARMIMIRHYAEQLSTLERQHLRHMADSVKISFLHSKLQLYSFAMLDNLPFPEDMSDLLDQAESTACELIELGYGMNLNITPLHVRRAMLYSAFILVRLLHAPRDVQREVLYDYIERVRQALCTTITSPGDLTHKAHTILQELPFVEDKHTSPEILSRMGASLFYDSLRVHWEHWLEKCDGNFDINRFDWNAVLGL
ncbi:hypothetical protein GQ53DRAFT_765808 [Thozetella sp. PMI_491]|nr:hypothetical protein GQ53DRAFT_765808 [Thozetella sp. PMI_491]